MNRLKNRKLRTALVLLMDELCDSQHPINLGMLAQVESSHDVPLYLYFILRNKRETHMRVANFFEEWIDQYLEVDYFKHFRMTRETTSALERNIHAIEQTLPIKHAGGLSEVPLQKRLLVTLWYLAKEDAMISIGDRFNLATSTVHRVTQTMIDHIIILRTKYIAWPAHSECETIAQQFEEISGFPGVIGAIDGCHIHCKVPEDQQESYLNRKFAHAIVLQGVCTATKVFTNVYAGFPASAHDSRVFHNSNLYTQVTGNRITSFENGNLHLVGDSAYPLSSWLMKPYPQIARQTARQRRFNTALSTTRVRIEHAFGLLKCRFRILQYVNVYSIEKAVKIIVACCVLHNFCLINSDDFDEYIPDHNEDDNEFEDNANANIHAAVEKRDRLADLF